MGSSTAEARPSTESADSNAPLIPNSTPFRPPPPNYLEDNLPSSIRTSRGSLNLPVSAVVIVLRILATIAGLAIGVSFALQHVYQDVVIALTVFVWVALFWDILLLLPLFANKPSLRVSLVMRDGRAIDFISREDEEDVDEQDGGEGVGGRRKKRRCAWLKRAFWIDFLSFVTVFTLTIVCHIHAWGQYRQTIALNWFAISFHIFVLVLTASPKLASAHVRFEQSELQIALP
ncbi:hypothetical protein NPX13_g2621 [Xylaria arbuscula]|uniref:Uncharacterized protein n=1 Tax=Xylaria arbuscula TaxID=114810 RepID=A0A9W8TQX5_9PEZI|nr:hypothetical protein NPX13_g2621 [Xylaria arbuscula]